MLQEVFAEEARRNSLQLHFIRSIKDGVHLSTQLLLGVSAVIKTEVLASSHAIDSQVHTVVQVTLNSVDVGALARDQVRCVPTSLWRYLHDFCDNEGHLGVIEIISIWIQFDFVHEPVILLEQREIAILLCRRHVELERAPLEAEHLILTKTLNKILVCESDAHDVKVLAKVVDVHPESRSKRIGMRVIMFRLVFTFFDPLSPLTVCLFLHDPVSSC